MLLMMLAVMLPAAALITASVLHLRELQRKKEIEAVIERDYHETLAIAEKRIDHRAYKMAEEIQQTFPDADSPEELDDFLDKHPNVAHAFLWTGKGHLDFESRPDRMDNPEFHEESKMIASSVADELETESKMYQAKLKKLEAGGHHALFTYDWVLRTINGIICRRFFSSRRVHLQSVPPSPGLPLIPTTLKKPSSPRL